MTETASPHSRTGSELAQRVASGAVLAALALGVVKLGGWPFAVFWGIAALGVFWEWSGIVAEGEAAASRTGGAVALFAATVAAGAGRLDLALAALAAALAASFLTRYHAGWRVIGIIYAGALLLAPVLLRNDRQLGAMAIVFLFAVVWATDILGYFVGRAIGGPKLLARISPSKTWSGACGGAVGALAAGAAVAHAAGDVPLTPAACTALLLSIVSQAGDLFESAVKRRFGVKDASHVIPGHGGLMDRLDGFLAASAVAALVGMARGGPDAAARGLLLW